MFERKRSSIGEELKNLEGENPWVTLSRLREQKRELDYRDGPDALSPDERVLFAQLTEQIDQLEERLHYKKAA
jgi:hypothetical protein